jgi:hypothetical protein
MRNMQTERGVGQESCLSPIQFNYAASTVPRKLLKGLETSKQEENNLQCVICR